MTLLARLVEVSRRVGEHSARGAKIRQLAELLRELAPEELRIGVLYLSGDTPQGRRGIGPALLQRAAAVPPAARPGVSLVQFDGALSELATLRGSGSAARKALGLQRLFGALTGPEQAFARGLLTGELRQGALVGAMTDALIQASGLPAEPVRQAAMYAPDLGTLAVSIMTVGAAGLEPFRFELFSPVAPMLAQTATDVAAALQELAGPAAFEWKMDGARIQVHRRDDAVRIFTRTLNDVTAALPEIVEAVRALPARECALDGEAIVVDEAGRPAPFQVTMRRFGRRLNIEKSRQELPIAGYFFDCLSLAGESLVALDTRQRFQALSTSVPEAMRMPRIVTDSVADAAAFYDAALAAGHEGVMAKALDAPYRAGNRDARWLKIKRAHTLDLVVLGAEWGHGRRTGRLSNLHLGALDPKTGGYVMLGKTFKGLTDAMLEWQTAQLLERETHRDAWTVYVRPELVVETAFSDLQASTRYPAGLALRLARVRRYRTDKPPSEADTLETVMRLYAAQ
jgi:DNA ligase-1